MNQEVCFLRWCNAFLLDNIMRLDNFDSDFSDGVKLCNLLEIISLKPLKHHPAPKNVAQKLDNAQCAINFITKTMNLTLVGISAQDIVYPKSDLILGMMWTIILRSNITLGGRVWTPKMELLSHVQQLCPNLRIHNFTSNFEEVVVQLAGRPSGLGGHSEYENMRYLQSFLAN